jgi:hypothetical protein
MIFLCKNPPGDFVNKIHIIISLLVTGFSSVAFALPSSDLEYVNYKPISYELKTSAHRALSLTVSSFDDVNTRPYGVPITSTLEYKNTKFQRLKISQG